LATSSIPTTPANYGYVFWSFNAVKDSTYYFDLCSSTGTTMSRLRLHNGRTTGNNYCMDAGSTPTRVLENVANGCTGTGTGLSKLIWTCQVSGTYYLESAGNYMTYWGVLGNQTATLSYKTLPSYDYICTDVFYDKGIDGTNGNSSGYNNNEDWIYTYYPVDTIGSAISAQFTSFSTSPGDILCVCDGNSINAPIIGCYSGPSITGAFSSTASDGSLTFQFISDDSGVSTGWQANVTCIPNIGIHQYASANKMSIYPNPVKDELWITGKVNHVDIYSVLGERVSSPVEILQSKNSETGIDVRNLPAGIYFIRIENESGNRNARFVKL
jgi:hypothetical protein